MRTTLTLVVLAAVLLGAAYWGWSAMTEPLPGRSDPPLCTDRQVEQGERVFPDEVTVSVYNASERNGLAGVTLQKFEDDGFGAGKTGNAPAGTKVRRVQVWAKDRRDPAVQLVLSRLGPRVPVVDQPAKGVGVTVVVGDAFENLARGPKSVKAQVDATICTPPVS